MNWTDVFGEREWQRRGNMQDNEMKNEGEEKALSQRQQVNRKWGNDLKRTKKQTECNKNNKKVMQ